MVVDKRLDKREEAIGGNDDQAENLSLQEEGAALLGQRVSLLADPAYLERFFRELDGPKSPHDPERVPGPLASLVVSAEELREHLAEPRVNMPDVDPSIPLRIPNPQEVVRDPGSLPEVASDDITVVPIDKLREYRDDNPLEDVLLERLISTYRLDE